MQHLVAGAILAVDVEAAGERGGWADELALQVVDALGSWRGGGSGGAGRCYSIGSLSCRRDDEVVETEDAVVGAEAGTACDEGRGVGIAYEGRVHIVNVATDIGTFDLDLHVVRLIEVNVVVDAFQRLPAEVMLAEGG